MTTLTQMEYIVAVDKYRNFVEAAKKCHVTQPTLSMQIQKLEDILQITIFDRSKQPVIPTLLGEKIIRQAKIVLNEAKRVNEIIHQHKDEIKGEFRLGIIPSVAVSLVPLFLSKFLAKYPDVELYIDELQTEVMLEKLRHEEIDAGIAATPLHADNITERVLYLETLVAYLNKKHPQYKKKILSPQDLKIEDVLVMSDGHCFKNQTLQLCKVRKGRKPGPGHFESNNFQTLINLVDSGMGMTLIPELFSKHLSTAQLRNIRHFSGVPPVREIALIFRRSQIKESILRAVEESVQKAVEKQITPVGRGKILSPLT